MSVTLGGDGLRRVASWVLRLCSAAALALDSYVHAALAQRYDPNQNGGISQGDIFRVEAAVAALAALVVVLIASRVTWAFVFVVAASAFGAVMLYRYNDVGALGPLPDMYEPSWYPKKSLAAYAEGFAVVTSAVGFLTALGPRRPRAAVGEQAPIRRFAARR
jgi:hypothetical protein